ncbi:uncharacterized protein [Drosophila takahashii]|uniref:uncharacterized protein n=1 Tax=Drosophila takahashii TaxID=29030 RepID=UPI00389927BD
MASQAKSDLNKFIVTADSLSHFEATLNFPGAPTPTLSASKIRREHVSSLWQKVNDAYDTCSECIVAAGDSAADTKSILKAKYNETYSIYERFAAQILEQIQQGSTKSSQPPASSPQDYISFGCQLPPIDTEIFLGDYLRWPTFRDLFTAIYIDNPSLTPVEKLYHLNAKTSGEAHSIVSKSPLTNDGFRSAWTNITERFENKRFQVNSHLKTLFNVQSMAQ